MSPSEAAYLLISLVTAATLPTSDQVGQPLNLDFNVLPGEPFILYLNGCDQGCTIALVGGPSDDLEDVKTLTKNAKSSYIVTFDEDVFLSGAYAFRLTANQSGESRYSSPINSRSPMRRGQVDVEPSLSFSVSAEVVTTASNLLALRDGNTNGLVELPSPIFTNSEEQTTVNNIVVTTPSDETGPFGGQVGTGSATVFDSTWIPGVGVVPSLTSSDATATAMTQPSSSLPPSEGNATSTSQKPNPGPLGPGPIAGIVIGVVAVVVLALLGLFWWWRRRRQRARSNYAISTNDSQRIPELEQPEGPEMAVAPKSPAELRGSTPPPPATEIEATAPWPEIQAKEVERNEVLEYSPAFATSELPEECKPLHPEHPTEKTPYEMDSDQQPKEPALALQSSFMHPAQQQPQTLPQTGCQSPSLSIASPDTGVSILPKALGGTGSSSGVETMSPASQSSDSESTQTRALLMEKYVQLEKRKQRLLELKQIEEEQADLEAKLRATAQ